MEIDEMTDVDDYLLLCRICATKSKSMINIFGDVGVKYLLLQKIQQHLAIKVDQADGLPEDVCISCASKINMWDSLLQESKKAKAKLLTLKAKYESQNFAEICEDRDMLSSPIQMKDTLNVSCNITSTAVQTNDSLSNKIALDVSPVIQMESSESPQVAFLITEKHPFLKYFRIHLVVFDKDATEDLMDKTIRVVREVKSKLEAVQKRQFSPSTEQETSFEQVNCEEYIGSVQTCFPCFTCNEVFPSKDNLISHCQLLHPTELTQCPDCLEMICGKEYLFERHRATHANNEHQDEKMLLGSMSGIIYHQSLKFNQKSMTKIVEKVPAPDSDYYYDWYFDWELIPLGEFNPFVNQYRMELRNKLMLFIASRNKFIHPSMTIKIQEALKKFLETYRETIPKSLEPGKKKVTCDYCQTEMLAERYLRHYIAMHDPDKIECFHCKKRVLKTKMHSHVEDVHFGGKNLICKICDKEHKLTGKEQPHMWTESWLKFRCTKSSCKRGFETNEDLEEHVQTVHTRSKHIHQPVVCDKCGNTYKNKISLLKHIKLLHTETKNEECICELCGKTLKRPCHLTKHKLTVHFQDRVPCPICDKLCKEKNLKAHIKQHEGAKLPCKYCGKLLTKKSTLRMHELRHEGVKRSKCPVCGIIFVCEETMLKHKSQHKEGEEIYLPPHLRPAQCEVCKRTVKDKYALSQHMKSHFSKSERAKMKTKYIFSCVPCKRRFSKKITLEKHIKTCHPNDPEVVISENLNGHDPTTKFNCPQCSKTFSTRQLVDDHVAYFHNKQKLHVCEICNKAYGHFHNKVKHMRVTHNI